ncbi:hypothetical protein BDR03DRAFT_228168 [Suillus americanus]|nr:hypothetical protein BDR03DRAFT_228168 [Suillus americanus]
MKLNCSFCLVSSLARDLRKDHHVALKILKGYASQLNREDKLQELKVLQCLSSDTFVTPSSYIGEFCSTTHSFLPSGHRRRWRTFMDLLGCNIQVIRASLPNDGYLPLPIVKRILRDVLLGIAYAHSRGVAHTGLLFSLVPLSVITEWLKYNPPRTHPPERNLTEMITAFVTQSFPPPTFSFSHCGEARYESRTDTVIASTLVSVRDIAIAARLAGYVVSRCVIIGVGMKSWLEGRL